MNVLSGFRAIARVAALALVCTLIAAASANRAGGHAAGSFSLEMDGVNVGLLTQVYSSNAVLNAGKLNMNYVTSMTSGPITWQRISFSFNVGMSQALYDWIAATTNGTFATHDGAVVLCNAQQRPIQRLEFTKAVIAVIKFPDVSVLNQDAGVMTLTLSVSSTKLVTSNDLPINPPKLDPARWPLRQFVFNIPNFDCSQVKTVESVTMYGRVIDLTKGNLVEVPAVPSLKMHLMLVAMPAGDQATGPFDNWFKLTNGKPFTGAKTGTIQYMETDGRVLFTLTFPAIGISSFADLGKAAALTQLPVRYQVELPFSTPTFSYSPLAIGH